MPSMFDFFSNRAQQPDIDTERVRQILQAVPSVLSADQGNSSVAGPDALSPRQRVPLTSVPGYNPVAPNNSSVGTALLRPSLVAPAVTDPYQDAAAKRYRYLNPVTDPTAADYQPANSTPISALEQQRRYTDTLSNPQNPYFKPVENNDHGVLGRIGDIFRQFVVSAGQAYNQGSGSPEQRLLGALGGGIAGGTYAGFHPQVDEERQRLYDISRSQQQEQSMAQDQMNDARARLINAQADTIPVDDALKLADMERKRQASAKRAEIAEKTLDWKKEDRDRYYELEQDKEDAKASNNQRAYDLALRKQVELEKYHKDSIASREKVAQMQVTAANTRSANSIAAANSRSTVTNSRQAAATVPYIRNQALLSGATPTEAEQQVKNFINSLPEGIRPSLEDIPQQ